MDLSNHLHVNVQRHCTGWLASAGPFSSLKTRDGPRFGPFFLSEWASWRDRNFDAGPARDFNFDSFSWFEPFLGESIKNKV